MTRSPLLVVLITGMILVALFIGQLRSAQNVLAYSVLHYGSHLIKLLDADSGLNLIYGSAHQDGADYCPIWSPDGRKFAFSRFSQTGMNIMVRDIQSGDVINLTRTLIGTKSAIRWSPDAEYVAFHHENDLYVGEVATGNLIRATETKSLSTMPLWSPDSTMLAYNEDGEIYLYTLENRETVRVIDRGFRLDFLEPLHFFDDATLMLGIHGERRRNFSTLDLNTGSNTTLIPISGDMLGEFAWTNENDTIAYVDYRQAETYIYSWTMNDPIPLLITDQPNGLVSWSPDQSIAYITYSFEPQTQMLQIIGLPPNAGEEKILAEFHIDHRPNGRLQHASWSPTGDYLAIVVQLTSGLPAVYDQPFIIGLKNNVVHQLPIYGLMNRCSVDRPSTWIPWQP